MSDYLISAKYNAAPIKFDLSQEEMYKISNGSYPVQYGAYDKPLFLSKLISSLMFANITRNLREVIEMDMERK